MGEPGVSLHSTYAGNLEAAREFEDFVQDVLMDRAIFVHVYRSRNYQIRQGESRAGIEIKLDRKCRSTKNLFIETEERHNSIVPFKPAGIYGKACLLLAIGDFHGFWICSARLLKGLHEQMRDGQPRFRRRETATAKGFLVPLEFADRWFDYFAVQRETHE